MALVERCGLVLVDAPYLAGILRFSAWFVAAKETLDLEWGHTIATVIPGWIAQAVTMVIAGIMLAVIGFGAVVFGGTFRSLVWQE